MDKFIMTMDPGCAVNLKNMGFKLAGQNGKQWFFINDEEISKNNKVRFSKMKCTTTNKILFNVNTFADEIYATQKANI